MSKFEDVFVVAQKLMDVSIQTIGDTHLEVSTVSWASDPKIIALALLCRTISNFKGVGVLINAELLVEASILLRNCYENLIYIGALYTDSEGFVKSLKEDEAASRQQRGNFILTRSKNKGIELGFESGLQEHMDKLEANYPKARMMSPKQLAKGTEISDAYIYYSHLSGNFAHVSASSLGRHLTLEEEGGERFRTVVVAPEPTLGELRHTLVDACEAILGVCITTADMLQCLTVQDQLRALMEECSALKRQQLKD
jgi:hypothetical protein